MKKSVLMFSLLSGTALMLPDLAVASGIFSTHKSTPQPEPAFQFEQLDKAYQTAGICFLGVGDCDPNVGFGKGDDYKIDTEAQCKNEGFSKQNCNSVQTIDGVCPYNAAYGKGCKCAPNLVSCPAGQTGVGESCGGKYVSCECDPALVSCASNQVGQGASCGGKYESCACKPEYKYTSSNCSYPRSVSGASCGGKYTGCSCPSGVSSGSYGCDEYYPAPCSSVCKSANADNCRNRTAVSTPYGCAEYWADCSSKCKTAYNDNCRNRDDVSHPYGCAEYWSDCQSKCKTAETASCESDLKKDFPNAVFVNNIGEVSSYSMSGKQVVLMSNISDTSVSLYIGNGTTIYSADKTGRSLCSKTSLSANVIQLAGSSTIQADITAKEFVFGGATVNVGGNKLTADTVTISSGNNYFANGSLIANGNMNINSDFNFGYGSAGGKLYANILSVAEGKTLTISGTGTTEIYERLDMNPTSNLNITNGTHNINVMKFISGASATKNAVKITGANVYLNKGKQASTTPYYNGVINASYSTGKSQVEITLSGSVLDLGSGELEYNEGTNDSKKLVFRLQNGSTMTNMGGLTCWGGKGLSFILDAGSKSSIQMLGKTSTCSGAETKFSAKNTSQQASITLGDDASGIIVFACMFYQSGSGYDYLCGRRATCTNVNGL